MDRVGHLRTRAKEAPALQGGATPTPSTPPSQLVPGASPPPRASADAAPQRSSLAPTTSTHAFTIRARYASGVQPRAGADSFEKQGNRGNIEVALYQYQTCSIHCFRDALALIGEEILEGNRTAKEARVKVYNGILEHFCARHGLVLKDIKVGPWCDNVFEDPAINAYLVPWLEAQGGNYGNRKVYLQLDKSHPDKAEMKGAESWPADAGAEYVFRVLPQEHRELEARVEALQRGSIELKETLTPLLSLIVRDRSDLIKMNSTVARRLGWLMKHPAARDPQQQRLI